MRVLECNVNEKEGDGKSRFYVSRCATEENKWRENHRNENSLRELGMAIPIDRLLLSISKRTVIKFILYP